MGKRLGEGIGAGKSRQYDTSGTVFGQQDFRDVEKASRDYTRGMGKRAIASGLKAGLTAGLAPGGGIYGEASRRAGGLRPTLAGAVGYGGAPLPSVPQIADTGIMDAYFSGNPLTAGLREGGEVQRGALMQAFKEADKNGGLIGYTYGGSVGSIEKILKDANMTATPEQLALFEQFDSTSLNRLAEGLQESLLSGTQQAQQAQAGTGFAGSGAMNRAQIEQRAKASKAMGQAQADAAKAFESQTLGDVASMIGQGAEFGKTSSFVAPTVSSLPTADQGAVIFDGVEYQWDNDSGQYITSAQFEQGMSTYYDDLYG